MVSVRHTMTTMQNSAALWQPRAGKPILQEHLEPQATMPINTLDTVRQRLAAEEPELRRRGVRHLALFGSVARGSERPDSDIDVAVEIEAGRSFSLIRMEETRLLLEEALRRRVDLGEVDSFRPQVRAAFEREKVPLF
jgi:predicted nucleotidyltransferase